MAGTFQELQAALGHALEANSPGSTEEHVLIALPSYSVSESLLSHYGDRIPSLEHRYLPAMFIPGRIPTCEFLFVSTVKPEPAVVDYYLSLLPAERQTAVKSRVHFLEVPPDGTARSVAGRLTDRPDLLAEVRSIVGGRPALIEPWNVTDQEVALALELGIPVNGTAPALRELGFKSTGRRLIRDAGVPVPLGREGVRGIDAVVDAAMDIRAERPNAPGVVIKHDDSGAGDGNVVIDFEPSSDADAVRDALVRRVSALPAWYLTDLERGGVVEERIAGRILSSPSCQLDIRPDGTVRVLATHEQLLGGPDGQVYLGCRFPADPSYAAILAEHGAAIGRAYARRGALGRLAVDFVTAADAPGGPWRVLAIEVNLRKGGTTHPYAVLRNLVQGRYDPDVGRWVADLDGRTRSYSATDNLVDRTWHGLAPAAVIAAIRDAGLQFDPTRGVGTVLHMLSGLAVDGRFGVTAIAESPAAAATMEATVRRAVASLVGSRPGAA